MCVDEYLALNARLRELRRAVPVDETEEDRVLDALDVIWWGLTPAQRAEIERRLARDAVGTPAPK